MYNTVYCVYCIFCIHLKAQTCSLHERLRLSYCSVTNVDIGKKILNFDIGKGIFVIMKVIDHGKFNFKFCGRLYVEKFKMLQNNN